MERLNEFYGVLVISGLILVGTSIFFLSKSNQINDKKSKPQNKKTSKKSSTKPLDETTPKKSTISSTKDSELKGYKTTNDGKIRTYFHRDLSESDLKLIGDTTPKPINIAPTPITPQSSTKKVESQWNAAGTWEERDYTEWAKKHLQTLLNAIQIELPSNEGVVKVISVTNLSGDASVIMSRGKRRYIYDFSLDINWKATFTKNKKSLEGKFVVNEITGDNLFDIKSTISNYDLSMSDHYRSLVDSWILSSTRGIRKEIIDTLHMFLKDFQQLHSNDNTNTT